MSRLTYLLYHLSTYTAVSDDDGLSGQCDGSLITDEFVSRRPISNAQILDMLNY